MNRNRTILNWTVLFLIISTSLRFYAYASNEIRQETRGNQSPAVYAPGGTVINNIGITKEEIDIMINQYTKEINKRFDSAIQIATDYQNLRLRELENALSTFYKNRTVVSDVDAKKWAEDIIKSSPQAVKAIEDQNRRIDQYNIELSKNIIANTHRLFMFVFEYVDSRLLAIQKLDPDVRYSINDFILYRDSNEVVENKIARKAIFSNGSIIDITISSGILEEGMVKQCPIVSFIETCKKDCLSFSLKPSISGFPITGRGGGGNSNILRGHEKILVADLPYHTYQKDYIDYLENNFEKSFSGRFDKFITYIYGK